MSGDNVQPLLVFRAAPCERSFVIHYRDGEPVGLLIDGKGYAVKPLRRGTLVRPGDELVSIVEPFQG